MKFVRHLIRNDDAGAAAELVLASPLLFVLMFGSMELGNYYLTQHAVTKQVRDGARYASRLTIAEPYSCSAGSDLATIFADGDAGDKIVNVTQTGSVDRSATGRFPDEFWTVACGEDDAVAVTVRCVDKASYGGFYSGLADDIPVVTVSASVDYPSLFGTLGFNAVDLCIQTESEAAVAGL